MQMQGPSIKSHSSFPFGRGCDPNFCHYYRFQRALEPFRFRAIIISHISSCYIFDIIFDDSEFFQTEILTSDIKERLGLFPCVIIIYYEMNGCIFKQKTVYKIIQPLTSVTSSQATSSQAIHE